MRLRQHFKAASIVTELAYVLTFPTRRAAGKHHQFGVRLFYQAVHFVLSVGCNLEPFFTGGVTQIILCKLRSKKMPHLLYIKLIDGQ